MESPLLRLNPLQNVFLEMSLLPDYCLLASKGFIESLTLHIKFGRISVSVSVQPFSLDAVFVNKLVPCAFLLVFTF